MDGDAERMEVALTLNRVSEGFSFVARTTDGWGFEYYLSKYRLLLFYMQHPRTAVAAWVNIHKAVGCIFVALSLKSDLLKSHLGKAPEFAAVQVISARSAHEF